jgi:probable O-glycosylation ligase (exosortase A-associated)
MLTKQLVFMIVVTLVGSAGVFLRHPSVGVTVYYLFATLRPQAIWEWSLPQGVSWSWYVAVATLLGAIPYALGASGQPQGEARGWTSAHAAMALFAAWVMVTVATARDREAAWPWAVEYLKIFVMYFVSAQFLTTLPRLAALYVAAALALGYIAYEVNALYVFSGYLGIQRNGYGGLDNNGAGLMLAMGVPLCFFAWQGFRHRARWLFLALVPVLVHAVLMTYSRGAMVSLIVAAPLIAWRTRSRWVLTLAGVGLALALPVMAGPEIRARFMSINQSDADESAQSRLGSWTAALKMAADNPVFGVGVRNANLFSRYYGADMEGRTIHSQYLQIAADNGFVGLAAYLAVLGTAIVGLARARRELAPAAEHDPEAATGLDLIAGVECSLAVFCVGGAFLSLEVFELPYLLLLLAAQYRLCAGFAPAVAEEPAESPASVPA